MVKTTKLLSLFILLAGCASTQKETVQVQPVSISAAKIEQAYPSWFVQPPEGLFGVGIAPFSTFSAEKSYAKAFEFAVEDLNSNAFVVITVEQYVEGSVQQIRDEIAIGDQYNINNTVKIDSAVCGDWVFYLVGSEAETQTHQQRFMPGQAPQTIPESRILSTPNGFLSMGMSELTQFNPYKTWALSKQQALKNLGQFTVLKVQALDKMYNEEIQSVRYIKSRIAIRNVRVSNRWIQNGKGFSLIEANQQDIINLTD